MSKEMPFTITISRQLGSGGAYLGQQLAASLNILYLDREILYHAAQELQISEEDLHARDERVTPRWQSWIETLALGYSPESVHPVIGVPTDQTLFNTESEIIKRISKDRSVVVVGRAGSHILREDPRHLSVFLHADIPFRKPRVQEFHHVSAPEALKLIDSIDRARARYLRVFTGQDWMNAGQYHLCIDTGATGLDKAEDIILTTLKARLGE
jgi:CMP/dCMP kinase